MITQTTVDNRPAFAAYINDAFEPTTIEAATMVKIIFTDEQGGAMFLTMSDTAKAPVKNKFNPYHEPGGSSTGGQFTSGGGSGGGTSSSEGTSASPKGASDLYRSGSGQTVDINAILDKHTGSREAIAKAQKDLEGGIRTDAPVAKGGFVMPNGAYTPARREVHRELLKKLFTPEAIAAATPKQGEKPTLSILGGRGGSGKSWFTKTGVVDGKHAIYVNSDDFKEALPEYKGWNAALLHEESSYLANVAQRYARAHGLNVINDATMRSVGSNARLTKTIEMNFLRRQFQDSGYNVNGYYMYASPQTAADRAVGRFLEVGRFVPPEYIAGSTSNEATFDSLRSKFHDWKVYDNDAPEFKPKLFSQKQDQKNERQGQTVSAGRLSGQVGTDPGGELRQRSASDERRGVEAQIGRDAGRSGRGDIRREGQAEGRLDREYEESKHPRDEGGKWTSGGGGTGEGGDKDSGVHPGAGYSASARLRNGVIYTPSVYDAQRALFENRKVELDQPKKISTLIKRLGETAAEMAKQGQKAPNFNLCNVTVTGTNLFCADTIGIPRIKMPQMDQLQTKLFRAELTKQGYKVQDGEELAANLRATQNELIGTHVASAVAKMKARGESVIGARLVISKDDYVLDGHHRWAAQLAIDAVDNKLTNGKKV